MNSECNCKHPCLVSYIIFLVVKKCFAVVKKLDLDNYFLLHKHFPCKAITELSTEQKVHLLYLHTENYTHSLRPNTDMYSYSPILSRIGKACTELNDSRIQFDCHKIVFQQQQFFPLQCELNFSLYRLLLTKTTIQQTYVWANPGCSIHCRSASLQAYD